MATRWVIYDNNFIRWVYLLKLKERQYFDQMCPLELGTDSWSGSLWIVTPTASFWDAISYTDLDAINFALIWQYDANTELKSCYQCSLPRHGQSAMNAIP